MQLHYKVRIIRTIKSDQERFRSHFTTIPAVGGWVGGWVGVESENKAISAFNYDVVEVEAEFGNISVKHEEGSNQQH